MPVVCHSAARGLSYYHVHANLHGSTPDMIVGVSISVFTIMYVYDAWSGIEFDCLGWLAVWSGTIVTPGVDS